MADSKGNILIVDDEAPIRLLLEKKLSSNGYHCIAAKNADDALKMLQSGPVDLVLLDIKLPGKSGMELLPEIKKGYPDVVVIMATVLTDIKVAIESIRRGAYDYIGKPFDMDTVNYCINRGIEKRRMEVELREYQQNLEDKGMLVRHFDQPLLKDSIRISIGRAEENDILLETLQEMEEELDG